MSSKCRVVQSQMARDGHPRPSWMCEAWLSLIPFLTALVLAEQPETYLTELQLN